MPPDWPIYFRDNLTLGEQDHPVAVCCLWMKQARLAETLPPSSYSLLGNLYSRDGINYLLRNVLARPTLRAIVLCGPDLTRSGAALVNLARYGIDDDHRIQNGPASGPGGSETAQIEKELPRDAVDAFRAHVQVIDLRGVNDPGKIAETLRELSGTLERGAFAEPCVFPRAAPAADEFPSEETGFVVRGDKVVEVWVNLLAAILAFGRRDLTAYTEQQRELLDVVATIHDDDPSDFYLPEWVPLTREQLDAYYPQLLTATRPENVAYTYGERLFDFNGRDQVAALVDELRATRYSRRAVAALWDPARDPRSADPPCLVLLQARARDGKLYLTAYFRSHDIFRAWLLNAFGLRKLQAELARQIGNHCMLGDLVIISQSAHIYADSWEPARSLTRAHAREYLKNPRLVRDPRGSFTIRVEGFQIRVDHYSPEGNLLATFAGTSARALQRDLAFHVSRVDHAIYLGSELTKAELALKNGWTYTQDAELRRAASESGDASGAGQANDSK